MMKQQRQQQQVMVALYAKVLQDILFNGWGKHAKQTPDNLGTIGNLFIQNMGDNNKHAKNNNISASIGRYRLNLVSFCLSNILNSSLSLCLHYNTTVNSLDIASESHVIYCCNASP